MALFEDLRSVIQLIDNLKDCGIENKVSLPRIVVIGTQSAGKSSLLESIVGMDFLPRGDGVVTRRPLELRLVHLDDDDIETYAEFADEPGVQYSDFSAVTKRIESKTNDVAGTNKKIVDNPITLTVYTKECPTLTLIDLPGITRVPLKGSDQPNNIEEITKDMARWFIKDERTIILCVVPANQDISTSDALQLAKEVDPDGKRTLGVLTKVDIMDRGTNILPVLKNDVIHLTHGYVAVKNRSQEDIRNNMKVQTALENEREFFENHRELRNVLDLTGTHILSTKLSKLLHTHIIHCLPSIEKEIQESLLECEDNLKKLGEAFPVEKGPKLYYLMSRAKEVAAQVKAITEGKKHIEGDKNRKFQGYAYFNLLVGKFNKDKNELFLNGLKALSPVEIVLDLVELKGLDLPGFLPKDIIEKQVKSRLEGLKIPTHEFLYEMKAHNAKIIKSIFESMLNVSGEAKKLLQRVSLEFLDQQTRDTKEFIDKIIEVEKGIIWTSDQKYFLKESDVSFLEAQVPIQTQMIDQKLKSTLCLIQQKLPNFDYASIQKSITNFTQELEGKPEFKHRLQQIKENDLTVANLVTEEEVVFFFEKLIRYFNLLNRNLSDTIIKIIASNMIIRFFSGLEDYFTKSISENIEQLTKITEDPKIQKRREMNKEVHLKLLKSREILQQFHNGFADEFLILDEF